MQKWYKTARRGSGILESQKKVLEEKGQAVEGCRAQGAAQLDCVFGEKLVERKKLRCVMSVIQTETIGVGGMES